MTVVKKLSVKTYGCQMNVYDSERMVEALGTKGYVTTDTVEDADMVLLNTCHIREKASEKLYSDLGRLRKLKAVRPDLKVGVAGCVAQAEGAEILRRSPIVDLVARGVREITLLGQNVNAYHGAGAGGDWTLARLIREMAKIDGLARIRYTTSHPNDMDDDLIAAHGDVPALMPYLHLPVQSGSDRILKAMNRKHTADAYRRLIERIRAARPDILFSSDFIVGFPGESDADFEATLALIREVRFGAAYSFRYSARPGTPAAEKPEIEAAVADARLQELQALVTAQQRAAQDAMVGREVTVLYEKPGRIAGQMVGKSDHLHAVHVTDPSGRIGDLVRVRITGAMTNSLAASVVAAPVQMSKTFAD